MSEFNPLVQRVDALLRRHQQQVSDVHQGSGEPQLRNAPADPRMEEIPPIPSMDANDPPPVELSPQFDVAARIAAEEANSQPNEAVTVTTAMRDDDDIPLLTEIVDPSAAPEKSPEFDQDAFGEKIEAAVLDKLLAELDRTLDQRLGRTITDLLEQVLHGLRAELSVSVRQMVREAVASAVAKEMAERTRRA